MKIVIYVNTCLLLVYLQACALGQMIDNSKGEAFTDVPFFNSDLVKKLKIKSISGTFWNYKLGDKLRNTDYIKRYEFNQKGELIADYESLQGSKKDTLIRLFEYDTNGNLSTIAIRDKYGYHIYNYTYNEQQQLIKYELRRSYEKCHLYPDRISLNDDDIISSESYEYEYHKNQIKQIILNQSGMPYMEAITYYNEENLPTGKLERIIRTNKTIRTSYYHNENKQIDSISITSKIGNENILEYVFGYDESKNLIKKEVYKNKEFTTQYQIIYKGQTNLINDILIQDLKTNFIRVIKLREYEYYK